MLNRSLSPTALSYSNLSLAGLHFANNGATTNAQTGIMPSATDEVLRLRKDVSCHSFFEYDLQSSILLFFKSQTIVYQFL